MSQSPFVNIIELPSEKKIYQSAFVFLLPPALEKYILELRKNNFFANSSNQLRPHLTVFFIGNHSGNDLLSIYKGFQSLKDRVIPFEISGKGTFEKNGIINNIHFKIKPNRKLTLLHNDALKRYRKEGLNYQTKYIKKLFSPHISIFNDIEMPKHLLNLSRYKVPKVKSGILCDPVFFLQSTID